MTSTARYGNFTVPESFSSVNCKNIQGLKGYNACLRWNRLVRKRLLLLNQGKQEKARQVETQLEKIQSPLTQILARQKVRELSKNAELLKFLLWQQWKLQFAPDCTEVETIDLAIKFLVRWSRTTRNKSKLYQMPCAAYQVADQWMHDFRSEFEQNPFQLELEQLSEQEVWWMKSKDISPKKFATIIQHAIGYLDAGQLLKTPT